MATRATRPLTSSVIRLLLDSHLKIILHSATPVGGDWAAHPRHADRLSHSIIGKLRAAAVRVIVHGPVGVEADAPGRLHRVDVGREEQELRAVLLLCLFAVIE